MRAAVAWSLDRGEGGFAARIVGALGMHAWFHLWSEFDAWTQSVANLVCGTTELSPDVAARAYAISAVFAWGAGDNERARRFVERGFEEPRRSDLTTAILYIARASTALTLGDVEQAVADDRAAVEYARQAGDAWWTGFSKAHLALSTAASSDTAEAAAIAHEALAAARRTQSATLIAYSAFALADTIIDDDPDAAVHYLEAADAAVDAAGLSFMVALIRSSLVTAQGRSSEALSSVPGYLELLEQWRTGVTTAHLRATVRNAAEMLARVGRFDVIALVDGAMEGWGARPPAGSPEAVRLDAAIDAARRARGRDFDDLVARGKRLSDDELVAVVRDALLST